MRLTTTLLITASCFIFTPSNSQVIWGAGSGDPVADSIGTFALPFGSPNGWTCVNGVNNAFFVRTTTGVSQGAYFGTQGPINSPTMANGVALFDSDYMDNAGIAGNFGMGVAPSPHSASLYSPFFDLTGYADTTIAVEFYLYYRNFSIQTMTVGISTDSGATWTDFSYDQNVVVNTVFPPAWVTVNMPNVLDNQPDLTNCQLRFYLDMDYYYVMFDDLRLLAVCPTIDTAVAMVNETLTSQATGATYQWVNCPAFTPAPGNSTDSAYTATVNGDYAVIVSYGNCVDTSACYTILSTGNGMNTNATAFTCYPNPSNGTVTFTVAEPTVISITDQLGKQVRSYELNNSNNNTITIVDLAPGCYMIMAKSEKSVTSQRLIVE